MVAGPEFVRGRCVTTRSLVFFGISEGGKHSSRALTWLRSRCFVLMYRRVDTGRWYGENMSECAFVRLALITYPSVEFGLPVELGSLGASKTVASTHAD